MYSIAMVSTIPFPQLPKSGQVDDLSFTISVFSRADLPDQPRGRSSSTSSRKSLFSTGTYTPEDPYVRHLNGPVILTTAIIDITFGGGILVMEVTAIILGKMNHHDGMFHNVAPGIWLGGFFLLIATLGLVIRSRFIAEKPIQYPVLAVYLGLNLLACGASVAMIVYIAYIMIWDRMTYRLCFGDSCLFDLRVFGPAEEAGTGCSYCNNAALHDVYIIMLFTMIIAFLFVFIFAFATVKITVRWAEFHRNYTKPEMKKMLAVFRHRQRRTPEDSVYKI